MRGCILLALLWQRAATQTTEDAVALRQLPEEKLILILKAQAALAEHQEIQEAHSRRSELTPGLANNPAPLVRSATKMHKIVKSFLSVYGASSGKIPLTLRGEKAFYGMLVRACASAYRNVFEPKKEAFFLQRAIVDSTCQSEEHPRICLADILSRLIINYRHHLNEPEKATLWFKKSKGLLKGTAWPNEWHMPLVMVPGLRSQPWWEGADRPPLADFLERHYQTFESELASLRGRAWTQNDWHLSVGEGEWSEINLYQGNAWLDDCELLPRTCELLKQRDEVAGPTPAAVEVHDVQFSNQVAIFKLQGGSRLRPHVGVANYRLYCHLGLAVPEGPRLRVGSGEPRRWEQGKAICFDDGHVHEAWHEGAEVRYVLFATFWHPDLSAPRKGSDEL